MIFMLESRGEEGRGSGHPPPSPPPPPRLLGKKIYKVKLIKIGPGPPSLSSSLHRGKK